MTNSSCGQPPEGGKSYGMIAMARCEVTGTAADRYINGTNEFRGRAHGSDTLIVVFDESPAAGTASGMP